jgi:hypothetical protein
MLPGHGNSEDNREIFAQPRAERDGRVANSPHTQHRSETHRQTDRQLYETEDYKRSINVSPLPTPFIMHRLRKSAVK